RIGRDREAERARGVRDDELAAPEDADRMRFALPDERRALLRPEGSGAEREEQDQGRGGGRAAVLQPEVGVFGDASALARQGSTAISDHSFGRFCTNCQPNRPLMQRCPLVTSWSSGDVTRTIALSCTRSSSVQPTPQYGQIVSVTVWRDSSQR